LPDSAQGILDISKAGFVVGMQQALLVGVIVMFIWTVPIFLFLPDHAERSPDVD